MCTLFCVSNNFFGVFFMKRTFKFLPLILCAVMGLAVFLSACGDNNQTTPPAHEHTFATVWTNDGTHHWYAATCEHTDQIKDKAAHDFEGDKCKVCNYIKPHEHTFATTWTTDGTHHWYAATCEHTDQIKDKAAHNFDGGETCIVCNFTKPHEHTFATTWTTDGTHHWHAATCEHTNETKDKAAHDFNGNKCTVCNYEKLLTWDDISNEQILNLFNEELTLKAAQNIYADYGWDINENNVTNATWYVSKDSDISTANLVFTYMRGQKSHYINLCKVEFATPLMPQNIKDKNIGVPTCTSLYMKNIDASIQEQRTEITNAICNTLFGAKTGATRYIIDNGRNTLDAEMGDVSTFTVIEITDNVIKEQFVKIKYSNNDEDLIAKLANENNYKTDGGKTVSITGEKL